MNRVFERFIAAYLQQYVVPRLPGVRLFTQASGRQRYLMQCGGAGVLRLKPDLLFEAAGSGISLVMDTKWKLLAPTERGRGGVGEADLYQLYAYTRRYGSSWSVLLYPHTPGLVPRDFAVLDDNGVLTMVVKLWQCDRWDCIEICLPPPSEKNWLSSSKRCCAKGCVSPRRKARSKSRMLHDGSQ